MGLMCIGLICIGLLCIGLICIGLISKRLILVALVIRVALVFFTFPFLFLPFVLFLLICLRVVLERRTGSKMMQKYYLAKSVISDPCRFYCSALPSPHPHPLKPPPLISFFLFPSLPLELIGSLIGTELLAK